MFTRWRAAGLVWPTLLTVVMLPVLIALGTWQLHRKAWKEDLIAKIEAGRTEEPVSYAAILNEFVKSGHVEYRRVQLKGHFDHSQERHVMVPQANGPAWHIYTLFIPDGGLPPLFVNRGLVPDALKEASKRPSGQIAGEATVRGLVRLSEADGWFTPAPDPKSNRWYSRNLEAMRWNGEPQSGAQGHSDEPAFAPFSIDAESDPVNPGGWPRGGTTPHNLPNRHLEYVLTWYGFALTLAIVFIIYARQRLAAQANGEAQQAGDRTHS